MAMSLYGGGALLVSLATIGWNAHDVLILKPEAAQVHTFQQNEIATNQVQIKALYDARIEQLVIQRDRIKRKPQKTRQDYEDIKDYNKQIEINKKLRDAK